MNMSIFRRSLVVVVSQSNRTQIVISITFVVVECVAVSSYRSRIAIVITALQVLMSATCCVVGRNGTAAWRRRCCIAKIQSILPAQARNVLTMTTTGRPPCQVMTFDVSTWLCPTVEVLTVFCCTTDLSFTAMSIRLRVVILQHAEALTLPFCFYYSCF